MRAKSVATVNEVRTGLITSRRIIFTPNSELQNELANTAIQITCIDRNGVEVKRVTSSDPGNVEDPEQEGAGNGEGENSGENQNPNPQPEGGSEGGNTEGGN